ncbi:helix-turn-helix transcriptional regulator [Cohnella sp. REN36]|uniref:helix-turn-helix transcriptional regulator n=1 Tax=Cohnella sp. REN36 TaxID=2887347 RepID=UPI001D13EC25|nr:helix-turn-helix transcriptional regulator [Cohnella sp. REN36]MCC3375627.1 helix-turn-helix transcriptional regulator [Cohnella sp. REN36]
MSEEVSYTAEEIAKLLKISKLTVYDLIKRGELPAYRVGKQMRIDASDLERYKRAARTGGVPPEAERAAAAESGQGLPAGANGASLAAGAIREAARGFVLTGQDVSLDLLARRLEAELPDRRVLRSYEGSINGLIALYRGEADAVSVHLWDGDTGTYNVPYIRKLLGGFRYTAVRLLIRKAGLYVRAGNPLQLRGWSDLSRSGLRFVNREKGAGARVLLDEQLRLAGIKPSSLNGYEREATNHMAVAGIVANGEADVGVGAEKSAQLVEGIDFVPLIEERYDLVLLRGGEAEAHAQAVLRVIRSEAFQAALRPLGYDLSETGRIVAENE